MTYREVTEDMKVMPSAFEHTIHHTTHRFTDPWAMFERLSMQECLPDPWSSHF